MTENGNRTEPNMNTQQNNQQSTQQTTQQNTQNTRTFADSLKNTTKKNQQMSFPTKNQAIVINGIDEISIKAFIRAVGDIIEPENIIFASRISKKRISIYLKSENIVDKILNTHQYITIDNIQFEFKKINQPSKKTNLVKCMPINPTSNNSRSNQPTN